MFHQGQIIRSSLNDYHEEKHLGENRSPMESEADITIFTFVNIILTTHLGQRFQEQDNPAG